MHSVTPPVSNPKDDGECLNPGSIILGQDIEFDTNGLFHNIINSTEFTTPNNVVLIAQAYLTAKKTMSCIHFLKKPLRFENKLQRLKKSIHMTIGDRLRKFPRVKCERS